MVKSIYEAARLMNLKTRNMDIIANNLANIDTVGYKRQLPFSEFMSRYSNQEYKHISDMSEGGLVKTGNPLDVALTGKGFFVFEAENGYMFSRNGKLKINDQGYLTDEKGNRLLGMKGPILAKNNLDDKEIRISISKNGEVKLDDIVSDKLLISKIDDQRYVERITDQGFVLTNKEFQTAEDTDYEVYQFSLEESNVNPITEMQSMIEVNKHFETTHKMINYYDTYLGKVNEAGKV